MTKEELIDDLDYITGIVKQNKKLIEENAQLQQENKQLKEDLVVLKKLQMISNDILNELEKHLIDIFNKTQDTIYCDILIKIQELKKKFGGKNE